MENIEKLIASFSEAEVRIFSFGQFKIEHKEFEIPDQWGRDKAMQLFQFFIISRNRHALHKEQIIERLWEENGTDQDFKVALHGINKALEPNKEARAKAKFVVRQGAAYKLNMEYIWLDSEKMEDFIAIGNKNVKSNKEIAIVAYQAAVDLYKGSFLPNRIFEDWTTTERERLQILALDAFLNLAEVLLEEQPSESLRLSEAALNIDNAWEEAYRIQMVAHMINGNRVQAIRAYQRCKEVLEKEFSLEPLPATNQLYRSLLS